MSNHICVMSLEGKRETKYILFLRMWAQPMKGVLFVLRLIVK
jgi:hypothetical protein